MSDTEQAETVDAEANEAPVEIEDQADEPSEQTFTQADVDRIVKERAERMYRRRVGDADLDDLKAKADALEPLQAELDAAKDAADSVPAKVTAALREHLMALHEVDEETADLFLTATDPERLIKQVSALVQRQRQPRPNAAQTEQPDDAPQGDWLRASLQKRK